MTCPPTIWSLMHWWDYASLGAIYLAGVIQLWRWGSIVGFWLSKTIIDKIDDWTS